MCSVLTPALHSLLKNFELLAYVNPINEEKERFFKSNFTVNPKFEYRPIKFNAYELKKAIAPFETDQIEDITIRHLYESVITGSIDQINMVAVRGTEKFYFNPLFVILVALMQQISAIQHILLLPEIKGEAVKSKQFGTDKAIETFKKAFNEYGFEGRIKVVKKAVSSAMVINSKKMVLIKEGAKFSQKRNAVSF